jgi:hypothetical protein
MNGITGADPAELVHLAQANLTASAELDDGLRGARAGLAMPSAACGGSRGGALLAAAHARAVDLLDTAVGRLVTVHEGDMDRLYRVAAAYRSANRSAGVLIE